MNEKNTFNIGFAYFLRLNVPSGLCLERDTIRYGDGQMTKDTCYYCNRTAFGTKVITIDADACHDGEDWFVTPIKEEVGLCQEHLEGVEDEKD